MEEWVFDSLMGFLRSGVWGQPVSSFIEQHCVVFDPGEENKFSYTEIHNEYQSMVEGLLESFMADLGVTAEQIVNVSQETTEEFESLLEQVLAAEDFLIFKSMMVQKNIDLELQALQRLQQQLGHSLNAYSPSHEVGSDKEPVTHKKSRGEDDSKILEEVLRQSKEEYDRQQSMEEEELEKMLAQAKEESLRLHELQAATREREGLEEQLDMAILQAVESDDQEKADIIANSQGMITPELSSSAPEAAPSATVTNASQPLSSTGEQQRTIAPPVQSSGAGETTSSLKQLRPVASDSSAQDGGDTLTGEEAAARWLLSAREEFQNETAAHPTTKRAADYLPKDLKAREAYLKRQRDHLLDMKRKEKSRQFDNIAAAHGSGGTGGRSKSAQVATESSGKKSSKGGDKERGKSAGTGGNTGVLCSAIAGILKKDTQ